MKRKCYYTGMLTWRTMENLSRGCRNQLWACFISGFLMSSLCFLWFVRLGLSLLTMTNSCHVRSMTNLRQSMDGWAWAWAFLSTADHGKCLKARVWDDARQISLGRGEIKVPRLAKYVEVVSRAFNGFLVSSNVVQKTVVNVRAVEQLPLCFASRAYY